MNRYKQWLLSLCWLLVFSVGFLSVGSVTAYASNGSNQPFNLLPLVPLSKSVSISYFNPAGQDMATVTASANDNDSFSFVVGQGSNVKTLSIGNIDFSFTPTLNHNIFDYYLVVDLVSTISNPSLFTFVPESVSVSTYPCDNRDGELVFLNDLNVKHYDNLNQIGFIATGKIPEFDNVQFNYINLHESAPATVGPNVHFKAYLFYFPKGYFDNSGNGSSEIIAKLNELIAETGDVESAVNNLAAEIQKQFEINENEDFGFGDIKDEVESKMGVLSFGSETLVSFLDLFSAESVGSTELTFPGFSIHLASERATYQVWPDYKFDLTEIEERFPLLINSVRTITVLCVWLAVLSYIVKRKDHFINK